ncbi:MAG TPA: efflux RND transporter periplasmic adaptor subunit [Chitinophagaceae bacterium]|nr:efflux RND transporter periplasmic adaptor subunit [Chitinophagaceae bacterium]
MNNLFKISLTVMTAAFVVACGSAAKDKKGDVGDLKVKLEKLKKEKTGLETEIRQVEEQIVKADPASAQQVMKLVAVDTVRVQDFSHYIELQGKVDAKNVAYVAPRGPGGAVKAIYVTRGQNVRKGQLILKLDDAIARQQVAAAQQAIAGLEAQAKLAQSVYERQQNLWRQNIGTEVQVLQAKTNAEAAQSQLSAARANVRLAQEQVSLSNVYAEISGTIDELNVKVGEFFSPGSASSERSGIRIVNTGDLKVLVNVPENYLSRMSVGTELEVVLPELNNRVVSTRISSMGKFIDPINRTFFIEGKLPADKDFRPNQIAHVKVLDYKSPATVAVPVNIVQSDEKGKYLYIMEIVNGKKIARKKVVNVGEAYGGLIEIKGGLTGGELIITDGYQSVYDGQALATT